MFREHNGTGLHMSGRLLHQYLVDCWAKIEGMRLRWFRLHQEDIRAETYKGLEDAMAGDDRSTVGTHIVLPATFYGGPRHQIAHFQDAMALVREFGKPDLFITFTANPHWKEITRALPKGLSAADCPDIIARVFQLRLKQLMHDLCASHKLGRCKAAVYAVEFQKRGLSHAHTLLILDEANSPHTPEDFNKLVSAEIPDPVHHQVFYDRVTRHMLHICGAANPVAPCIKGGKCRVGYPKSFQETTQSGSGSYPLYRRRQHGFSTEKHGHVFDNRHVVPYNQWLLERYNCHMNVEICSTVQVHLQGFG